ncbi:uncharacterized protein HMPREF1541_06410 [Cyphellophora europaea CBS 101466]|uniref:Uncharacterized protein n=1 Tax=Cyphellophora europaea (strain CBS 101466) TaxID=1220924 RepID=W2RQ14_CYPE1|nr:uncharacterized protein HMPREF1541_06410 [Cyphellophora europaea CBS 101466]ETN38375.1 hypothetical protein HMPREF1541_06410 [Cyphellophora europaea CBS 101466]
MPSAVTKPVLPPLQTTKSASLPSEIVETPLSARISAVIKQEQCLKTPITPPAAYTDYLKALTPVLASPPTSALARSMSDESTATRDSVTSNPASAKSEEQKSPQSNGSQPPTPYRRTSSGLRRLRIPHSPAYSPSTCGPSPRTTMSSLPSGSAIYSPFSPADWSLDSASRKYFDAPRSACSKPVTVRSTVTRTVTYKRSPPLDPAPKGKRRKLEEASEMPPPSATSPAPPTAVA